MGMFDDVNYECVCPVCHGKVTGFQSKDGKCDLEMIEPSSVSNFYSSCNKCGVWIEFYSSDTPVYSNFTRKVSGKGHELLDKYTKKITLQLHP